ncbi:helix-turn-helix DNA binding domain protein [Arthrobacter phage Lakshmi]|uniref:Helix-turn-helix DNA-binding domain protein n=2 Tax=Korravirus TaxID=1982076 RepID=A0A2H4PAI6_9CAUD|nr:HTH DNA binding protein [Arthrobacter phage Huntingdon]AOQ28242.1 helix-turn-helix DNA-binding domain protein [Arthrobacter phage RcigaStruga]ATW59237.1 helix-turn-helix DNA-binding domain protein [Arthrobacter phage Huntingdon]WKW85587.1 helix-turn-helix DNA binding domain protein [Arthrobacter phage Lakshmi]
MPHVTTRKLEQIQDLLDENLSHTEIAKRLRVSRTTIRYYFPDRPGLSKAETLALANAARKAKRAIVRPGITEQYEECLVCGADRLEQRRLQKLGKGTPCTFRKSHSYTVFHPGLDPDCPRCQQIAKSHTHHTCQNN